MQTTFSGGALHNHIVFAADDGDGDVTTTPPEGIYLTSYVLQADGLEASDPFFFVHRSAGLTNDPRDVAADFANLNYNILTGLGDFDLDGDYDLVDIDALVAAIAAGGNDPEFDLDGDGITNGSDLTLWREVAGSVNNASGGAYLVGDANLDGFVDASDFNIWNGASFTNVAAWSSGDFNADGVVDASDFNIWNGSSFQSSDGIAIIPEPAGAGLAFVAAMMAITGLRRRGRSGNLSPGARG